MEPPIQKGTSIQHNEDKLPSIENQVFYFDLPLKLRIFIQQQFVSFLELEG